MLKSGLKVQNVNPNFQEEAINPSFLYKNCSVLSTACKVKRKTLILSELVERCSSPRLQERQAARMWKAPDQLVQEAPCRKKLCVYIKRLFQSAFVACAWTGGLSGSWASFSEVH